MLLFTFLAWLQSWFYPQVPLEVDDWQVRNDAAASGQRRLLTASQELISGGTRDLGRG